MLGKPTGPPPDGADALVVALKTRTIPVADAVAQSLDALAWLRTAGVRQVYFKYCSTFDSTDAGNIGPVADALLEGTGSDFQASLPGLSGRRPDDLPGSSVLERPAFVRKLDAQPPADADARSRPGPRDGPPDQGGVGLVGPAGGGARARRGARRARGLAQGRPALRRARRRRRRGSRHPGRGRSRTIPW